MPKVRIAKCRKQQGAGSVLVFKLYRLWQSREMSPSKDNFKIELGQERLHTPSEDKARVYCEKMVGHPQDKKSWHMGALCVTEPGTILSQNFLSGRGVLHRHLKIN